MIKLNKPKFWDKNNISLFSILLLPLSLVTLILIFLKDYSQKLNHLNTYNMYWKSLHWWHW